MYTLVWTAGFTRTARKFLAHHPELHQKIAVILRDPEIDPFQFHLKFQHLAGILKGIQAVSISHSCRIMVSDKEIILLDIGSHDEVYR